MKKTTDTSTPLVDEHLLALHGMPELSSDEFFYTRLKARMENTATNEGWFFRLNPVWVLSTMALLLILNISILTRQTKAENGASGNGFSLQDFAQSYDQAVSSSY